MRETNGEKLVRFAERFGVFISGKKAGQPLSLAPFQKELLIGIAESGAREAYVQLPRKNGKSMLGAILCLHALCADGEYGAQVFSIAGGSREQSRIVFNTARRMVELGPLRNELTLYQHEIVHKASGSRFKALATDAGSLEGLEPSFVCFDELHVLGSDRRLWDVMSLGSGTRECPLLFGITTPGVRWGSDGRDSFAFTMYEKAKRIENGEAEDPNFFYRIWDAPMDAELHDESAWKNANPALGDFLDINDMRAKVQTTPENEFRTKRMGQWVASQTAWLPAGAWDACEIVEAPAAGTQVVLGFDGSENRDSTALVGATIEPNPAVFVIKVWEKPLLANNQWQVDRLDVAATVYAACEKWNVIEFAADPSLWQSELQQWELDGIPVLKIPQNRYRGQPSTQRFYEAVLTQTMRHDANPILARHIGSAVLRPNGTIGKEHKDSGRKIDTAVAAVMAYERACVLGNVREQPFFVL